MSRCGSIAQCQPRLSRPLPVFPQLPPWHLPGCQQRGPRLHLPTRPRHPRALYLMSRHPGHCHSPHGRALKPPRGSRLFIVLSDVLMFFSFLFFGEASMTLESHRTPFFPFPSFPFLHFGYLIDPYVRRNHRLSTHATHAVGF